VAKKQSCSVGVIDASEGCPMYFGCESRESFRYERFYVCFSDFSPGFKGFSSVRVWRGIRDGADFML